MNTKELFNLKEKTAIVTGGANGIGKATALILAKHGANISIGDFNTLILMMQRQQPKK